MALTLKDVVESRAQQRMSAVRRDSGETTRRETFALDRSDRRDALDSQSRASAARSDTVRTATAKAAKDEAAKAEASKSQDAPRPAQRASAAATDRSAGSATASRPPSPKSAKPTEADEPATAATESEGVAAGVETAPGAAETDAAPAAKAEPESPPAMPAVTGFVPPPAPTLAAGQSVEASTSGSEGEPDLAAAGDAAKGPGVLDLGAGPSAGIATAETAGFEAALQSVASGASAGDTAASTLAASLDASAASGAALAPSATADAKATAAANAAQLQTSASGATASVPLGAVPMTIGLRALGASNRFEIRLDPKELGRIDVSIDIDKDTGKVGARLVVDRPETLALLQRDASSLQQALAQTGLDASAGISLSLRSDQGQRNGSDPGADAQGRGAGQHDRNGLHAGPDQTATDLVPLRLLGGLGRVDIRI